MSFSHLDEQGRVRMVDVSDKPDSVREATAEGRVHMRPSTVDMIVRGEVPKGDVLTVGRLAGIGGAKEAARLIPLCHPVATTSIQVEVAPEGDALRVQARVRSVGRTGPEMEALTAVSVACLALYDMCKSVDDAMEIGDVRLLSKSGGKSGAWRRTGRTEAGGE